MAIDVRMPKLSDNMEEGIIIRWMKSPGDEVTRGEPLAEVETDKADVELEASDSGVLREIKVAEGQSAAVGAVIAVLAPPGEAAAASGDGAPSRDDATAGKRVQSSAKPAAGTASPAGTAGGPPAARAEAPSSTGKPAVQAPGPAQEGTEQQAEPQAKARDGARPKPQAERAPKDQPVRASPLAWRLADEAGVNLAGVRGSGPGGRILKRDVEASVRAPTKSAAPRPDAAAQRADQGDTDGATAPHGEPAADEGAEQDAERPADAGGPRIIQASRMRLAIAKRMAEAKRDIPHFYVGAEIDMTEAMHLRESIKRREAMVGLTVTHLLLRALAMALGRHPRVNASWRDGAIELHDDVNIGVAVAVEDGLVVPVLHRAQTLTLGEIAARAAQLTDKARSGKFTGEELTGGTFSLSNVGMLAVDELVAVINPPQAAILAVASVKDRPVVRDGQLAVAKTMRAVLSCDHRVLNGVEGGRFLEELKAILENPVTLLLE
jgi:pyruvate dehydrogenase E2 component (dihydrolipoamide acetyltransferase)